MTTPKRNRPTLTLTIDADLKRRIRVVADTVPGGSMSSVVEEMVRGTLPAFEAAIEAMRSSLRDDGTLDEERARGVMAQWLGATLLKLHDTPGLLGEGGESG